MTINKDEICYRCERPILIRHPQYPLYCMDCARQLEAAEFKDDAIISLEDVVDEQP